MDALLYDLQNVCGQLLPIIGAVALIFLCVLLKKMWQFVEELTARVKGLDSTLKLVDESMEKAQAPLDTAVKYSHSLDKVHDKAAGVISKAADFADNGLSKLKKEQKDPETEEEVVSNE